MEMTPRARHFIAITLAAVGVFTVVAFVTAARVDWPFDPEARLRAVHNLSGPLGSLVAWASFALWGRVFAWLVPFVLFGVAVGMLSDRVAAMGRWIWKATAAVVLLNAFFALTPLTLHAPAVRGRIGDAVAAALSSVFGEIGSTIVVVAAFLLVVLGELTVVGRALWGASRYMPSGGGLRRVLRAGRGAVASRLSAYAAEIRRRREAHDIDVPDDYDDEVPAGAALAASASMGEWIDPAEPPSRRDPIRITGSEPAQRPRARPKKTANPAQAAKAGASAVDDADKPSLADAALPPLSILDRGGEQGAGFSREELRNWSTVLDE